MDNVIYKVFGNFIYFPRNSRKIAKSVFVGFGNYTLSYFYGAKIGVLGLNGSGKSSLLRILAGVDKDFNGQANLSAGYTVGFLEQEPLLNETKTVREIVEQGVQDLVDLHNEYNRITERFAEPMSGDDMNRLIERQGEVQEKIDSLGAWDLDARLEMAMDALRCPEGNTPIKVSSGGSTCFPMRTCSFISSYSS
jgi:ATPase subunit of ABC transporter with duplicated ATPase domains